MKYPKPSDRYDCSILCDNFEEINERLIELEENGGGGTTVTTESITEALGYTPANEENVSELSEQLLPLHNMNGCYVCNGEDITLTVGEDIEVGQVIAFKYKKTDGYSVSAMGSAIDSVIVQPVASDGYSEATFEIKEGHETCKFTGVYFVVIRQTSGSGLPDVTTADNNKILQVVEGVWQLIEVLDGNTALFYADGNEVAY